MGRIGGLFNVSRAAPVPSGTGPARRWLLGLLLGVCAVQFSSSGFAGEAFSLQGRWQQGAILIGRTGALTAVSFNGRPLRVSPQGLFVFGLDRDEKPDAILDVQMPGEPVHRYHYVVQKYDWPIQRVDGLQPDKVNPPDAALVQIDREAAQIKAARQADSPIQGFAQAWRWPVKGEISGLYGRQRILNGTPKQPHYGLDIAVPAGTPVLAPTDGIVRLAQKDLYFTGGTLILDQGQGIYSLFAHLSEIRAQPGQSVKQGSVLALSGATGRATGPHLHWGVYWFEAHCDPAPMVHGAELPRGP